MNDLIMLQNPKTFQVLVSTNYIKNYDLKKKHSK